MIKTPIELPDAVIYAMHLKAEDGKLQNRLLVRTTLTAELSDPLDARNLIFAPNGTPKSGFSSVELDTGCPAFRAVFEAVGLPHSFELVSGDSTDQYRVTRLADGVMQLKLRLNYHGDPYAPIAFLSAVGDAPSRLKIIPLQTDLDEEPVKTNAEYAAEESGEEESDKNSTKAPRDAVRQRLLGRSGPGRRVATSIA